MKRLFLYLIISGFISNSHAQETVFIPDTLVNEWVTVWVGGLNGSQSTFNNWAAGGQNNVAATIFTKVNGAYRKGNFTYGYVLNLRYGITNIEGEDSRKTDDRIATKHRASYIINEENTMNAFAEISFITQFYAGYDYSNDPRKRISDFMAPGYFNQTIGYAYTPKDFISFEAGLGLKQTFVNDEGLTPSFGVEDGENIFSEGGFKTGISFSKDILKNLTYTSRFETFSNLKKSLVSTDFSCANEITGRINDYLSTSFQFEMLYDDDIIPDELQTKQILSAGLLITFR
jgi:hypothetical protein